MRAWLGLVALAISLGGCGGERSIALPASGSAGGTGTIYGELEGDARTGCVWLRPSAPADGSNKGLISLVWPSGFTARTNPIRVYRADGRLAATAGERLRLGGKWTSAGDRCRVSDTTWLISTIERSPG